MCEQVQFSICLLETGQLLFSFPNINFSRSVALYVSYVQFYECRIQSTYTYQTGSFAYPIMVSEFACLPVDWSTFCRFHFLTFVPPSQFFLPLVIALREFLTNTLLSKAPPTTLIVRWQPGYPGANAGEWRSVRNILRTKLLSPAVSRVLNGDHYFRHTTISSRSSTLWWLVQDRTERVLLKAIFYLYSRARHSINSHYNNVNDHPF